MLQRIDPNQLNARQKEIYNFQQLAALLGDYGFNCIKLADDWDGTDFLAHSFNRTTTLKVQLKGRLTIGRKYVGRDLYVAFPDQDRIWYLIKHDELVDLVEVNTPWLESHSWRVYGGYSSANPSRQLRAALRAFALNAT